jgi:hypothetical protein
VWVRGTTAQPLEFDAHTIFELGDALPGGRRTRSKYLLNRLSTVFLGPHPFEEVPISPTGCTASSSFSSSYVCENVFGEGAGFGDWSSAGDGVGAWINVTFDGTMLLTKLDFTNRCSPYSSKQLRLSFSDGSSQVIVAEENCDLATFSLTQVETSFVTITTESIYERSYVGAKIISFYGPIGQNSGFVDYRGYNFRNPPSFIPYMGSFSSTPYDSLYELYGGNTLRPHAMHETDALIDVLFEHNNTAPFVAVRLIQRLVTSNPSPRYVQVVVDAFSSGSYGDETFSGVYGDLGAAVAAVLLDREARSSVLDADPRHGQLREPLLKVLHMIRSMDYQVMVILL